MTPDHDMFPEQVSLENDEITTFRIGVGDVLPAGLSDANTYRFRRMPDAPMMDQLRRDALHAAAALAVPPGVVGAAPVAPVAPAPAPPPGPAVAVGNDEAWVCVESTGGKVRGEEIALTGGEIIHGDVGLKAEGALHFAIRKIKRSDMAAYPGKEAAADARLLSMSFQGVNRSERQWRDVSREIKQEEFADWVIPGPRTTEWCVRFLNRKNGGPVDHHRWWVQSHGLKPDSWGVAEHDNLMKIIDRLGRYDGLDLANLSGVELACRRLQLIEYVYSDRGPGGGKAAGKGEKKKDDLSSLSYEATIFGGGHKEYGDTMVAPALLEYVAKEVESEASVMKQVRKAREERVAAAK